MWMGLMLRKDDVEEVIGGDGAMLKSKGKSSRRRSYM